jgi:hypothetical protein
VHVVSIVTPTKIGREELLLDRCRPSVERLDWPRDLVEHIVVSDVNPKLRHMIRGWPRIKFIEINDTWRDGVQDKSVGAVPWHIGSLMAQGEFVGFLGDDDEVLPHHVTTHIDAMKTHQAMFSISPVQFVVRGEPVFVIGDDSFEHGHLDSTGIMCHVSALRVATWSANGQDAADYRLVRDWRARGLKGVFTGGPHTVRHHDGWAA